MPGESVKGGPHAVEAFPREDGDAYGGRDDIPDPE